MKSGWIKSSNLWMVPLQKKPAAWWQFARWRPGEQLLRPPRQLPRQQQQPLWTEQLQTPLTPR